jgi:AcrR family transcriptional regulator
VDRQQIVRTALTLLNEVGLEGLTLRRIATELGVKAPALYWHVKNKEQLLDEMATLMYADALANAPRLDASDWIETMRRSAIFLRSMMLGYRDGAKVFSGSYLTDSRLYGPENRLIPVLRDAGFELVGAIEVMLTVLHYTIGATIEEQEVFPAPGVRDPRYEVDTLSAQSQRGAEMTAALFDYDPAQRFLAGVELILAGARSMIGDHDR